MTGSLTFRRASGAWGSAYDTRNLYKVEDAEAFNASIGSCWMKGRIQKGDVILCTGHSGDYFHNFTVLQTGNNFARAIQGSEFGAYRSSGVSEMGFIDHDGFKTLMSGESIRFHEPVDCRTPPPQLS